MYGALSAALTHGAHRALMTGATQLVLDLREVSTVDAEGVGALVELRRTTLARGARLSLVHARPRVLRVLGLVRLTDLIVRDADDALSCALPGCTRRSA